MADGFHERACLSWVFGDIIREGEGRVKRGCAAEYLFGFCLRFFWWCVMIEENWFDCVCDSFGCCKAG